MPVFTLRNYWSKLKKIISLLQNYQEKGFVFRTNFFKGTLLRAGLSNPKNQPGTRNLVFPTFKTRKRKNVFSGLLLAPNPLCFSGLLLALNPLYLVGPGQERNKQRKKAQHRKDGGQLSVGSSSSRGRRNRRTFASLAKADWR